MKRLAIVLALPALLGAATEPSPLSQPLVMPLFRRVFDFRLPLGYVPQPLQRNEKEVLLEILPGDQTFDTWTHMITVRGLRGLGASPLSTRELATRIFDPKACGKAGNLAIGAEQPVFGALRRTVVVISCGRSPGNAYPGDRAGGGEQDFIYLFRDNDHLYSLQYAVRGAAFETPPIDLSGAEALLEDRLGPVHLCATDADPGCEKAMAFARANGFK